MKKAKLYGFVLAASISYLMAGNAQADTMTGGDWQGRDLIAKDGDTLSGVFTNIGRFIVPTDVSVSAGSDNIAIYASSIIINSAFDFQEYTTGTLTLQAGGDISIGAGVSISPPEGNLILRGGTISVSEGPANITAGDRLDLDSGSLTLASGAGSIVFVDDPYAAGSGLRALTYEFDPIQYIPLPQGSLSWGSSFSIGGSIILSSDPIYYARGENIAFEPILTPIKWYPLTDKGEITAKFSSPIPEPATMLLAGTGLTALAGTSRRRKRRQPVG